MSLKTPMTFTFTLLYKLDPQDGDHDALVERLFEAGCGDALIGLGRPGHMALEFVREDVSADDAVTSARACVSQAVPRAQFLTAHTGPAVLRDIGEVVGSAD